MRNVSRHDKLSDIMMSFWCHDELFDVMSYFWRNDEILTSWWIFWRHDAFSGRHGVICNVMTYLWRHDKRFDVVMYNCWCNDELFDVVTCLWRHDELFDVMTYCLCHNELFDVWRTIWSHGVYFLRHDKPFWHHDVFLFWPNDEHFNVMTNFLASWVFVDVMTNFLMSWRICVYFMTHFLTLWPIVDDTTNFDMTYVLLHDAQLQSFRCCDVIWHKFMLVWFYSFVRCTLVRDIAPPLCMIQLTLHCQRAHVTSDNITIRDYVLIKFMRVTRSRSGDIVTRLEDICGTLKRENVSICEKVARCATDVLWKTNCTQHCMFVICTNLHKPANTIHKYNDNPYVHAIYFTYQQINPYDNCNKEMHSIAIQTITMEYRRWNSEIGHGYECNEY